ncbi:unnamed protein product [Nesidiocoris tenuis]|uniref:Uncharacterized protein n=1 Tax=Nesidiocoris tenuis TaxID=355587 RepID=A0A6H5H811_9HEMI|nr:unnamed protein product [Nesidiocoris tenuis]
MDSEPTNQRDGSCPTITQGGEAMSRLVSKCIKCSETGATCPVMSVSSTLPSSNRILEGGRARPGQVTGRKAGLQVAVKGPAHRYIFHHKGEQLFGGPVDDYYPSNSDVKIDAPSTTHEGGRRGPQFANAVVERIWYTSAGRGIRVSEDTPLFFSQNETTLVLTAKNALPYPTDKADVVSK